jgi:hypothetical protein
MRALILIACAVFLGFMAAFYTDGVMNGYSAAVAAGALLLSMR